MSAHVNESSAFVPAFDGIVDSYGRSSLFRIVTVDAGITAESNMRHVHSAGYMYLAGLKANQPTLLDEACRLLGPLASEDCVAETEDWTGCMIVRRRLYLTEEMAGYHAWTHMRTTVRVETERRDKVGTLISSDDRYFVSNMARDILTDDEWLRLVRAHWRVENDVHKTLDVSFEEDDRPWFYDPYGMLVVMLLRRIAYNLIALFRIVSLGLEPKDAHPWRFLLSWIRTALVAAREADTRGLRWKPKARSTAPPAPA